VIQSSEKHSSSDKPKKDKSEKDSKKSKRPREGEDAVEDVQGQAQTGQGQSLLGSVFESL
jgi:hypothetical protein